MCPELRLFCVLAVIVLWVCTAKMLYVEHVANFGCAGYHCK
jgi:hypothetical protein